MSEFIIKLENVSVNRENNTLISNLNLELKAGNFLYLTGKTGSGKSSLLKTLYADLPLQSGTANVVGYDLKNISKRNIPFLRRKLGIIFQDYKLLQDRNLFENLSFAAEAAGETNHKIIKNLVNKNLADIGLESKAKKMPFELSGGEQQLVVIARALINNPQLILADEPTGNLDEATADKVMQLLINQTKKGTAVIMTTHNEQIISKYPARVLKFD